MKTNDKVRFSLTDYGKTILEKSPLVATQKTPIAGSEFLAVYTLPLWRVMQVFGPYQGTASEQIFIGNEISPASEAPRGGEAMCYNYTKIRDEWLFTDEGQRYFLSARDTVLDLLRVAGAIRALQAIEAMPSRVDTWEKLSCLDRMEEIGELVRVYDGAAIQGRVYKFRDYNAL